jgi:hypothetical protein
MTKLGGTFLVIQLAMLGMFVTLAGPATAVTKSQVAAKVLSLQNMPTGWSVYKSEGSASDLGGCLKGLQAVKKEAKGIVRVSAEYQDRNDLLLEETIEAGPGMAARYRKFNATLSACKAISYSADGSKVTGTVAAMSFPKVGDSSSAYAVNLTIQGETLGIDIVFFKVGQFAAELLYAGVSPDPDVVNAFANEAVDKIHGKATSPPSET